MKNLRIKIKFFSDLDFEKFNGRVPFIAQERGSGMVPMLAYANLVASQENTGNRLRLLRVKVKEYFLENMGNVWTFSANHEGSGGLR